MGRIAGTRRRRTARAPCLMRPGLECRTSSARAMIDQWPDVGGQLIQLVLRKFPFLLALLNGNLRRLVAALVDDHAHIGRQRPGVSALAERSGLDRDRFARSRGPTFLPSIAGWCPSPRAPPGRAIALADPRAAGAGTTSIVRLFSPRNRSIFTFSPSADIQRLNQVAGAPSRLSPARRNTLYCRMPPLAAGAPRAGTNSTSNPSRSGQIRVGPAGPASPGGI